jgi:opacity protein-like surface antigen
MTHARYVAALMCVAVVLGFAAPSSAQSAPRAEFSAGWRLLNVPNAFGSDETLPLGWYADVAGNVNRAFAAVGEVSGNYKSFQQTDGVSFKADVDLTIHTFLGGVRFNARQNPAFTPYLQAMFGLARGSADAKIQTTFGGQTTSFEDSESESDFAFDAGGGVNINVSDSFAVRVGAGYLRIGGSDGGNSFRFSAGVVVPF